MACPACVSSPTFRDLLDSLEREHDRVLSQLETACKSLPSLPVVSECLGVSDGAADATDLADTESDHSPQAGTFSLRVNATTSTKYPSNQKEQDVRVRIEQITLGQEWQDTPVNLMRAESLVSDVDVPSSGIFSVGTSFDERDNRNGCILRPDSVRAMLWDVLGAFLILYDIFAIPLAVFPLPASPFMDGMTLFCMCFWTLNIPSTLLVGYYDEGTLVMSPSRILWNYVGLRERPGWLWLDVPIVSADWLIFAFSGGSNSDSAVSLLRAFRLVRLSRLLRVGKLKRVLESVNDVIDSERLNILASIVQMIVMLLLINHVIACLWYYISYLQGGERWIDYHGFADDDWLHLYVVSFHWSITQFTPSSMHVQPQSLGERTFAIAVVVFALVGFSYIVGSISGSLARLRGMHEETAKQFWDLRRYLKKNKIPKRLSTEARRYIARAWRRHLKTKPLKDIKIFALLSSDLRHKIEICQFRGHLLKHPLLGHTNSICKYTLPRLADAVVDKQYYEDDTVFNSNEQAECMYFIASGHLQYDNRLTQETLDLLEGQGDYWISEHCLWMPWRHLGNLTPRNDCRLLLLNPVEFTKIMTATPKAYSVGLRYARHFKECIKTAALSDVEDGRKRRGTQSHVWEGEHQFISAGAS